MTKRIEDYISENLIDEAKAAALEFVAFLRNNNIEFYRDKGSYWKDKIYYWLKFKEECVAFIVIKDPDEPDNLWTVWSDDSATFNNDIMDDKIKNNSWIIAALAAVARIKSFLEENLTEFAVAHLELIIHNQAIYLF